MGSIRPQKWLVTLPTGGRFHTSWAIAALAIGTSGFLAASAALGADPIPARATFSPGDHVTVTTTTGQVVRGQIDAQTSANELWLVVRAEGMWMASVVAPRDILKITASDPVTIPPTGSVCEGNCEDPDRTPVVGPVLVEGEHDERPQWLSSDPVTSLAIHAELENWDSDPQPDGLRVWLIPRTKSGTYVPAVGNVVARLAVQRGDWRSPHSYVRAEEEWSQEVNRPDFGPDGAVVDLPFRSIHPETDRELLPLATLHVRLAISGVGAFDAAMDDVEIRTPAITRELPWPRRYERRR